MSLSRLICGSSITLCMATAALAQNPTPPAPASSAAPAPATIASRVSGLERHDGLIPVYIDPRSGKVLLELARDSMRVLMFVEQASGLGSNPIGIDRGASGEDQVARFDRNGDRVLVVFENWKYRSSSRDNPAHVRSVAESFPTSTAGSMPIVASEGTRMLVDATDFLLRDWTDVVGTLARTEQGSYTLARDRSGVNRALTNAYPNNTEIDLALTFAAAQRPGPIVSEVAPDGREFTLREHVAFVRLPEGYTPRALDPRVGFFGITFHDYAQPIQAPLEQRWISRHRLERVNPNDPNSPIKNPIVYYVDPGMPEPIRTAALEGARFWTDVFDKAGLKGAFKVELLPQGADPMDARYNVVQWVNRNERGWSVGGSLGDPRTGEIIKAMARLDSHRNRTAYNLYAALVGAEAAAADTAFVLGRVRQVTSHEMGHTLGLAHNYIASTYSRGSVMDYPAPRVTLDRNGKIDVSQAYAPSAGDYDVWAIRWAYGIFPPATEKDSLAAIVQEGLRKGYLFLSDADARPDFASDPRVNLWDDSTTAEQFFITQRDVRRVAIQNFGLRNIRPGEPVATLQERFVPLYFFHRFAINSLTKSVGGVEYQNAVAGDRQQSTRVVPAAEQRRALALLTGALAPKELAIPDTVITLLGPRPFGYSGSVELFRTRTAPAFDELGAARTLAQMIVDGLLQRNRDARLVQQATHDREQLRLDEVIDALVNATWNAPATSPKEQAIARAAGRAVADGLLALAADRAASPEVRAMAEYKIGSLRTLAKQRASAASDAMARAHWSLVASDFTRWIDRRELPQPTPGLVAPPGDPFGDDPDGW